LKSKQRNKKARTDLILEVDIAIQNLELYIRSLKDLALSCLNDENYEIEKIKCKNNNLTFNCESNNK